MAVAKAKAAAPRTITRDEPVEARAPERTPERGDPNQIMTRDGRPVDLGRVQRQLSGEDRTDLARMGIHPPKGWTYEWRTRSIKGAEATEQMADDQMAGWTPVPASRHEGLIMQRGHQGPIVLGAAILCERDERLTAMSAKYRKQAADSLLRDSRNMAGMVARHAPNSESIADFSNPDARANNFVRAERIPMGDPTKNYNYSLDE